MSLARRPPAQRPKPCQRRGRGPAREVAVLFDAHRNVWEVWRQSRPVAESIERQRVCDWAVNQGYSIAGDGTAAAQPVPVG